MPACFDRGRAMLRSIVILLACGRLVLASATVQAASLQAFVDVRVAVARSCRIDIDAIDMDGARLGITRLLRGCDGASTAQIRLGPAASGNPNASAADVLIASAAPARLHGLRVPSTVLRLTIDF